jgi:MinD-like ATPase involved in chromosome partitioning or flagellar assembly
MRVIAVGSGKGGTGKSFVATNAGLALARQGLRTCVVDLDFGSADVHLLLGQLQPRRGVLEVLRGEALSLAEVMIPVPACPHLFIVPGAGETVRASGLSGRETDKLIADIRELPVDVALLDLPGGVAHQVLDLFLAADTQLVVTTPDAVSMTDAARFLHLARVRRASRGSSSADKPRHPRVYTSLDDLVRDMNEIRGESGGAPHRFAPSLVLNRCHPDNARARAELVACMREEAGDEIELPVRVEIPEDAAVGRSVRLLAPLLDLAPGSPASRSVLELAASLAPSGRSEPEHWAEAAQTVLA